MVILKLVKTDKDKTNSFSNNFVDLAKTNKNQKDKTASSILLKKFLSLCTFEVI